MPDARRSRVAIVDYGMGNLFSVKHACGHAGLDAALVASPEEIRAADAVLVPGVGAFGTAMDTLTRLGLVDAIKETAARGKLLVGICLGMQLLMDESHEFGRHRGLGLIPGDVIPFPDVSSTGGRLKVPQVGWNGIHRTDAPSEEGMSGNEDPWHGTFLEGLADGELMYFVHSFYVRPAQQPDVVLARSEYGGVTFCSALVRGNVMGCQFHPERSGPRGLDVYRNVATLIGSSLGATIHV